MLTILEWILLGWGLALMVLFIVFGIKALRWPMDEYDVTPNPRKNVRRVL